MRLKCKMCRVAIHCTYAWSSLAIGTYANQFTNELVAGTNSLFPTSTYGRSKLSEKLKPPKKQRQNNAIVS